MSEMVERVGRALAWRRLNSEERILVGGTDSDVAPDGLYVSEEDLGMARAAIAAMRESTEAMNTAGDDLLYDTLEAAANVWAAMIDAALR